MYVICRTAEVYTFIFTSDFFPDRQSASEVRQEASSAFKLEELDSNLRTLETILHQAENNPLVRTHLSPGLFTATCREV